MYIYIYYIYIHVCMHACMHNSQKFSKPIPPAQSATGMHSVPDVFKIPQCVYTSVSAKTPDQPGAYGAGQAACQLRPPPRLRRARQSAYLLRLSRPQVSSIKYLVAYVYYVVGCV